MGLSRCLMGQASTKNERAIFAHSETPPQSNALPLLDTLQSFLIELFSPMARLFGIAENGLPHLPRI
jgi:hypothetical protein